MASIRACTVTVGELSVPFPTISLLDRRGRPKQRAFVLVRALEMLLWPNAERKSGAGEEPRGDARAHSAALTALGRARMMRRVSLTPWR